MKKQKKKRLGNVKLLGTGKPLREFIHSRDLAMAIFTCLKVKKALLNKKFDFKLPILNVGTKEEISIKNLSQLIKKYIGYRGKIKFDKSSPDGTYRKNLNSDKIINLGWSPQISFKDGLKEVIDNRKK